eukprot:5406140-Pyramimonas_sp.AAC.1
MKVSIMAQGGGSTLRHDLLELCAALPPHMSTELASDLSALRRILLASGPDPAAKEVLTAAQEAWTSVEDERWTIC